MKNMFTSRLLACLAFLAMLWPLATTAAPFTPGNLVVLRVGDGTAILGSASTAAFLQEYTPTGTLVQTIALPTAQSATATNRNLTVAGSSSTDGGLTRSANGTYLLVAGYDAAPGVASISGVAPATANRIVGRVAADGTVDTSTRLNDATGNLRTAASADGLGIYTAGSSGGVRYVPFGNTGASTVVSATPGNLRYVNTFGGNLYISSGSSPFIGISQVGTGLPTSTGQTATLLPGFTGATPAMGTSPSALAFYFADLSTTVAGLDVVYVADDRAVADGGGIQKYSLVGNTWTLNGTIAGAPAPASSPAIRGLDGMTSGTTVSLVASGNGGLFLLSDNAGYNAAPSTTSLPAPIATAAAMTAFRGAAFAPVASAPTNSPTITSFTPATGAAGATVTLTGTNFTGATGVTLNGAAITGFTVVNPTTITFTVPAGASSGTIGVTTPGGTATSTGSFTVTTPASTPTITGFTPASGASGATVTLTGTNFTGATAVTLNGMAITGFTVVNGTTITFTVPTGATSGTIGVTTPGGTATSSSSFTVSTPMTGNFFEDFEMGMKASYAAGTVMLASGPWTFDNALLGAAAPNDKFNGLQSARIRGGGFIAMNFDKPNGAGTVTINAAIYGNEMGVSMNPEISTNGGMTYTSIASGPITLTNTLTAYVFTVNQTGNVRLRISSTNTMVGMNPRINIDDITITDAGAPTTATLTVTPATLSAFTTTVGTPSASQSFTLSGTMLTAGATITAPAGYEVSLTAGSGYAASVTVPQTSGSIASTTIYVRLTGTAVGSPAGNVTVASTGATTRSVAVTGTVSSMSTPAPTITSFSPASAAVGATVTITGTNLTGATAVTLNGVAITGFTVVNPTTITFTVPTGATSGTIGVTTAGGTATSTGSLTVAPATPAPTVTSFSPARAVAGQGFTLTVSGTNLVAGTVINFNGNSYTGMVLGSSGTGYSVVIPASGVPAPGTYNITATNSGGTSAPLSFLVVAPATTVAYEDFEQGSKTGYATGTVMLRSGTWTFTEALVGNQFNDKVNQVASARIRGGGSITMNFDKPNGAGVISLQAALYGNDAPASFTLEISTNGGTTYTVVPGTPAALTTTLTTYSYPVNTPGNIRLRISSTNTTAASNPRINIDDLNITDFFGTGTREASQAQLKLYPNPVADVLTVGVNGSAAGLPVQVRDLLGRSVLNTTLPASGQLSLGTLPAGTYLLTVDGKLTRRITKE